MPHCLRKNRWVGGVLPATLLKGTVMQIEKALINDRLRVLKVF